MDLCWSHGRKELARSLWSWSFWTHQKTTGFGNTYGHTCSPNLWKIDKLQLGLNNLCPILPDNNVIQHSSWICYNNFRFIFLGWVERPPFSHYKNDEDARRENFEYLRLMSISQLFPKINDSRLLFICEKKPTQCSKTGRFRN